MDKIILRFIPQEYLVTSIFVLIILIFLLSHFIPKIVNLFSIIKKELDNLEELSDTVMENTENIKEVQSEINVLKSEVHNIEHVVDDHSSYIHEGIDERKLILKSLFCILNNLEEIDNNNISIKDTKQEINDFLIHQTHKHSNIFKNCKNKKDN